MYRLKKFDSVGILSENSINGGNEFEREYMHVLGLNMKKLKIFTHEEVSKNQITNTRHIKIHIKY